MYGRNDGDEDEEEMDEFALYKAMAYNHGRRGSRSLPSTPILNSPSINFNINRTSSVSDHRRKRRQRKERANGSDTVSETGEEEAHKRSATSAIAHRLARITLSEIACRRRRMPFRKENENGNESDVDEKSSSRFRESPCQHSAPGSRRNASNGKAASKIEVRGAHRADEVSPVNDLTASRSAYVPEREYLRLKHRGRAADLRNEEDDEDIRPRTYSMPTKGPIKRPTTLTVTPAPDEKTLTPTSPVDPENFYLLRTFSTSKKGIVNRGDSFKRRGIRVGSGDKRGKTPRDKESSEPPESDPPLYRVLLVGGSGVGKSSLLRQFTSSDYRANLHRGSISDSDEEQRETKTISVILDDQETSLFIATARTLRTDLPIINPDAYVIMYSVTDGESFTDAQNALQYLLDHSQVTCLRSPDAAHHGGKKEKPAAEPTGGHVPVILVANKSETAKERRQVSFEDGKVSAVQHGCKYTEISSILNIRVDDLLAGIVQQIRLRDPEAADKSKSSSKIPLFSSKKRGISTSQKAKSKTAKDVFQFLWRKRSWKHSKSCDNLMQV